ncbi:hypothetical protein PCC7424_2318 [Gloeothece citriformis PCC 7424]|uniref:Uncharacterized protein n=1 Tax=Gloeothece citriformis (strain PCC 7424) TaxID=65393 RepID=B7KHP4_GLOC7|nr:hypothetical protein [Gloeothece citriformis]ACK70739.1 hypothetical protein PCC7424_2318 [Gloeothece citriformis PCC 7424]
MLDFSFYSHDKKALNNVDISQNFYEWLIQSEFSKIGQSEEQEMQGDGETVKVSVVLLEGENRRKFSDFFRDAIVHESDSMLEKLGESPSKEEYIKASSRLKQLQDLRKAIEDEKFKYFSRG